MVDMWYIFVERFFFIKKDEGFSLAFIGIPGDILAR